MEARLRESSFDPSEYKVQRATESFQSKDVKYLDEGVKKSHEHHRLKLDEAGSRETTRAATYDEILALLEAEVKGLNEITKHREVIADQYKATEVVRETSREGKMNVERSSHKQRMAERMQETPQWSHHQQQANTQRVVNDGDINKDNPRRRDDEIARDIPSKRRYLHQNATGVISTNDDVANGCDRRDEDMDVLTEKSGIRHEIRHKRQIIEEVVLYDIDTFYENQNRTGTSASGNVAMESAADAPDAHSVTPDIKPKYAKKKKGKKARRREPKTVTYLTTRDESEIHSKLARKDWTKFKTVLVYVEAPDTKISVDMEKGLSGEFHDAPGNQSTPVEVKDTSQCNINIDPTVAYAAPKNSSPKQSRKTVTPYVVTYERPNASPSNLKAKFQLQKKRMEEAEERERENERKYENAQQNAPVHNTPYIGLAPPELYSDANEAAKANTMEMNVKTPESVTTNEPKFNFEISQISPSVTTPYIFPKSDFSTENQTTSHGNASPNELRVNHGTTELEIYGKVKHRSQEDIHFIETPPAIEMQKLEKMAGKAVVPDKLDVKMDANAAFQNSSSKQGNHSPPIIIETIAAQPNPASKPRKIPQTVTYLVSYQEPYINRPRGKYRRSGRKSANAGQKQKQQKFKSSRETMGSSQSDRSTPDIAPLDDYPVPELNPVNASSETANPVRRSGGSSRKARRSPVTITYVITYDKPLYNNMANNDSYTGGRIRNWHTKQTSDEMALPETVGPRAEIKASDMRDINILVESPETRKIRFKPTVQFKDDVDYDNMKTTVTLVTPVITPSRHTSSSMKADVSNFDQDAICRPALHEESSVSGGIYHVQRNNSFEPVVTPPSRMETQMSSTLFSSELNDPEFDRTRPEDESNRFSTRQISETDAETVTFNVGVPSRNLKRKQKVKNGPQVVTFVVNADFPSKWREWDIGRRKLTATYVAPQIAVKPRSDEDTEMEWPERYVDARKPGKARFAMQERTPEASMVIPESSSLEFPVQIPQVGQRASSSGRVPQTVTYVVNRDSPTKRREWDIKIKQNPASGRKGSKRNPASGRVASIISANVGSLEVTPTTMPVVKHKQGRSKKSPVTVTYRVDHDPPQKYKEWDLKTKKTAHITTASGKPQTLSSVSNTDFLFEDPDVHGLQFRPCKPTERVTAAYNIGYEIKEQPVDMIAEVKGDSDIEVTNFEVRPGSSSVRLPRNVVHEVEYNRCQTVEDVNINLSRHARQRTHENYQTTASAVQSSHDEIDVRVDTPKETLPSYTTDYSKSKFDNRMNLDVGYQSPPVQVLERVESVPADAGVVVAHPVKGHKKKRLPQTVTYNVNYGEPKVRKEWDLKGQKPRSKAGKITPKAGYKTAGKVDFSQKGYEDSGVRVRPARVAQTVTYKVEYDLTDGEKVKPTKTVQHIEGLAVDLRRPQTAAGIAESSPRNEWDVRAQEVMPSENAQVASEVSFVEFEGQNTAISLPTTIPSRPRRQPQVMTYEVVYDRPVPRREWDIMRKKSPPKVVARVEQPVEAEGLSSQFADQPVLLVSKRRSGKLPITMTYQVAYNAPEKRREWDIMRKKSQLKAPRAVITSSVIAAGEVPSEAPTSTSTKPKRLPQVMTYQVTTSSPPQKYREWDIGVRRPRHVPKGKVSPDIASSEYSAEPATITVPVVAHRKGRVPVVKTYVVDYDAPEKYREWDIMTKPRATQPQSREAKPYRISDIQQPIEYQPAAFAQQAKASVELEKEKPDLDAGATKMVIPLSKAADSRRRKPVTVTYVVNREPPSKYREWDIATRKKVSSKPSIEIKDRNFKREVLSKGTTLDFEPINTGASIRVEVPIPEVNVVTDEPTFEDLHESIEISEERDRPTVSVTYAESPIKERDFDTNVEVYQESAVVPLPFLETNLDEVMQENVYVNVPTLPLVCDRKSSEQQSLPQICIEAADVPVTEYVPYSESEIQVLQPMYVKRQEIYVGTRRIISPVENVETSKSVSSPVTISQAILKDEFVETEEVISHVEPKEARDIISYGQPIETHELIPYETPTETQVVISAEEPIEIHQFSLHDEVLEIKEPISYDETIQTRENISHDEHAYESELIPYSETFEMGPVISHEETEPTKISQSEPAKISVQVSSDEPVETNIHISHKKPTSDVIKLPEDQVLPSKSEAHTVTYMINYGPPQKRREWDIKMKKPKSETPLKPISGLSVEQKDEDDNKRTNEQTDVLVTEIDEPLDVKLGQVNSKVVVLPHTVTYKVNYDAPQKKKEWDIGEKKSVKQKPQSDVLLTDAEVKAVAETNVTADTATTVSKAMAGAEPRRPKSVTFIVKYDMPMGQEAKKTKSKKTGDAKVKDIDLTERKEVDVLPVITVPRSEDTRVSDNPTSSSRDVQVISPTPAAVEASAFQEDISKTGKKKRSKEAKTMTFIVKYDMPIGQLKETKAKPKADKTVAIEAEPSTRAADDSVRTATSGEITVENPQPQASVTVDIPALEVSKVATQRSPDKKSETITYVVNYKLPTMVDKEKKNKKDLGLKITEPASPTEEQSSRQNVKDSDDVKALLEGPGTYFHVAQPSPDISISAPELGKQAPKKKKREAQQVTYNVTYDVITRKPASKKAKSKKESSTKKAKTEGVQKIATPVAVEQQLEELMVNVERPTTPVIQICEPATDITVAVDEPKVEIHSDVSGEIATHADANISSELIREPVVYVVDENELINIEDDSTNIDSDMKKIQDSLAELDRELNYQMNLPEIDYTVSYDQTKRDETLVLEAPEMFANLQDNSQPSVNVSSVSIPRLPVSEFNSAIEIAPAVIPTIVVEEDHANPNLAIEAPSADVTIVVPQEIVHAEVQPKEAPLPEVSATESQRSITYIVNYDEVIKKMADKPKSKDSWSLRLKKRGVGEQKKDVREVFAEGSQVPTDAEIVTVTDQPPIEIQQLNAEVRGGSSETCNAQSQIADQSGAAGKEAELQPGVDEAQAALPAPEDISLDQDATAEELPPAEGTIEVLKVLAPLIQSGAMSPKSSRAAASKVTYIVHHDELSQDPSSSTPAAAASSDSATSTAAAGKETRPRSTHEDDWGASCFGRQSSHKPIRFDERQEKSQVKPTLAVSPHVRAKIDDQCVLIKIAADEVTPRPPEEFSGRKATTSHFVVVAIDFGTAFSGYAFRFTRDASDSIHIMRQWEGGDPGAIDYKTLSTLLLTPEGKFHSFGFTARDFYHDLSPEEAKRWMYFEKFKMALHTNTELNIDTEIVASNGQRLPALLIFSYALRFFKEHALQELSEQSLTRLVNDDVQWILTVPAIWKAPAKQFMRRAAYQAGIASPDNPDQLLISLEPEAASISVRRERFHELVPDTPPQGPFPSRARRGGSAGGGRRSATPGGRRSVTPGGRRSLTPDRTRRHSEPRNVGERGNDAARFGNLSMNWDVGGLPPPPPPTALDSSLLYTDVTVGQEVNVEGTRYMIVDCGGGTVDITVHEIESNVGSLREVYKATGGPYGSLGVDREFERLLACIFGEDFIDVFKRRRPAGWVDLMMAFESRKRAADPYRPKPLNVSLPFSFTDYHKKYRNMAVETVISKYGDANVTWSRQGMLRLLPDAMEQLFRPTLKQITATVDDVISNPSITGLRFMFLVGGFAESPMLQLAMRRAFGHLVKILIPYDVSLAILKGAVSYGCDPAVVSVRKSRLTYGVAVQTPFVRGVHPKSKLVVRDGAEWCADIFDPLVLTDQSLAVGETISRHYKLIDDEDGSSPASKIHVYASEMRRIQFTTDAEVTKCGTLCLEMSDDGGITSAGGGGGTEEGGQLRRGAGAGGASKGRDVQLRMTFGNTEINVAAIDTATGRCIRAAIDFLSR